jgi:sugar phosphate isomerase/epimerase
MYWGGRLPSGDDLRVVAPFVLNLHVKDYGPGRPEAPWWPVGQGETPWADILDGVLRHTDLTAVTLETHVVPLREASEQSLAGLRTLIADARARAHPSPHV